MPIKHSGGNVKSEVNYGAVELREEIQAWAVHLFEYGRPLKARSLQENCLEVSIDGKANSTGAQPADI